MAGCFLGIDIGGTRIKSVVLSGNGEVLEAEEQMTEDGAGQRWKQKIIDLITKKAEAYGQRGSPTLHSAISAPGLVDRDNRMTLHMPERLQGIEQYHWAAELGREIWALNDGHAACLAEYESRYRAEGVRHMLMLTLGTGVGGGMILDGELYQGHAQRAGHVGHMTVDLHGPQTMTKMPGSLEYAFGNFSVGQRTGGEYQSVRELVEACNAGDPKAREWWLESVEKLAVALASLVNILSPERILLGGGIAAGAGNALLDPLARYMGRYEWRPGGYQVPIALATHGTYAGAMGAAYFARSRQQKS